MDYSSQAADILHFCQKHSFKNVSLLGHSMLAILIDYLVKLTSPYAHIVGVGKRQWHLL